jgi:anti-sigma factor RsiW
MANCPFNSRVMAYHDGELSPSEAEAMRVHLTQCDACIEALRQHEAMSTLFIEQQPALPSQISMHRLHRSVDRVASEGIVRIAHILQAIAAVLLVISSVWLARQSNAKNEQPDGSVATVIQPAPPWLDVMRRDSDSTLADANTPAATWYLASDSRDDDTP